MSYVIKTDDNTKITCNTAEEVFSIIKKFTNDETFWNDVINDEVGEDFYAFGKFYKPADVLKAVDRKRFDDLCVEFWEECKQDVVDEINDLRLNEVSSIYGFEVQKCST